MGKTKHMEPWEWRREAVVSMVMSRFIDGEIEQIHETVIRDILHCRRGAGEDDLPTLEDLTKHMVKRGFLQPLGGGFFTRGVPLAPRDLRRLQGDAHWVELFFDGGVMTAKLICPASGCSEHEGHCNVRDWFDNTVAEELLEGRIAFPVAVSWDGGEEDGPTLKLVPPNYEIVKESA